MTPRRDARPLCGTGRRAAIIAAVNDPAPPFPGVPAILLAAGASSRMGRPKALLPLAGAAFVDAVAETLRAGGARPVLVILGSHEAEIRRGAKLRDVEIVSHAGWAAGRTSSIQAGLRALPSDAPAAILALVDMPFVRSATVAALLRVHAAAPDDVEAVVPSFGGRRGHPVLLRRPLFPRVLALGPDEPLSTVIRAAHVLPVAVDDPGIHTDLDAPEDLPK
ncbi:MAG: Molybdenum cofactor guanylyltransferase [Planctomycetes bacterium]|nr:Molybdenum cofactor guanylyltransferase [Planctomycetota bacterium]